MQVLISEKGGGKKKKRKVSVMGSAAHPFLLPACANLAIPVHYIQQSYTQWQVKCHTSG